VEYRKLGHSGLDVSAISIGCWPIVGDAVWGPQDKQESIAALHTALDCGVNFFDSAEAYGNGYSEELLGEAFAGQREKVIIASKAAQQHLSATDLRAACEASLRRLRSDYIDVYYLHWPSRSVPFAETMKEMETLKREGKIRVLACSNFGVQDLPELLACGRVETNELPYNLLFRAIEYGILPLCARHRVSVTVYMPLMQGLLTGKFRTVEAVPPMRARTRHFAPTHPGTRHDEAGAEAETFAAIDRVAKICSAAGMPMADVALAWPLQQRIVSSVIVGVRNAEQVRANIKAASLQLPPSMIQALDEATRPLKEKLGPNADMWDSGEKSRYR